MILQNAACGSHASAQIARPIVYAMLSFAHPRLVLCFASAIPSSIPSSIGTSALLFQPCQVAARERLIGFVAVPLKFLSFFFVCFSLSTAAASACQQQQHQASGVLYLHGSGIVVVWQDGRCCRRVHGIRQCCTADASCPSTPVPSDPVRQYPSAPVTSA